MISHIADSANLSIPAAATRAQKKVVKKLAPKRRKNTTYLPSMAVASVDKENVPPPPEDSAIGPARSPAATKKSPVVKEGKLTWKAQPNDSLPKPHSKLHVEVQVQGSKMTKPSSPPLLTPAPMAAAAAECYYEPRPEPMALEDLKMTPSNQAVMDSYGYEVLGNLHLAQKESATERSLERHYIPADYRARMVNWMIDVMATFHQSRRAFFLAVMIMDNYYSRTEKVCGEEDLHLTGVTCIYMASKLEEVYTLRLKTVYSRIGHKILPKSAIIAKEREILQTLQYFVTFSTAANFIDFYIAVVIDMVNKAAGGVDEAISDEQLEVLKRLKEWATFYATMAAYDYEMLKFFPSTVAAGSIYAAAMKLSAAYLKAYDPFLIQCIRMLTSEEEKNVKEMEQCARVLVQLEAEFGRKFPGMNNVFMRELLP